MDVCKSPFLASSDEKKKKAQYFKNKYLQVEVGIHFAIVISKE